MLLKDVPMELLQQIVENIDRPQVCLGNYPTDDVNTDKMYCIVVPFNGIDFLSLPFVRNSNYLRDWFFRLGLICSDDNFLPF